MVEEAEVEEGVDSEEEVVVVVAVEEVQYTAEQILVNLLLNKL